MSDEIDPADLEMEPGFVDPFNEEALRNLLAPDEERDLADRLGDLLWEIGKWDGSNDQIGDARMAQFVSIAIFKRPDGGQVCRVAASNRDGSEIPPWELKGLLKHLADTLDPALTFFYIPTSEEDQDDESS